MAKIEYLEAAREFFTSSKFIKFFYLICFTLVITAIISSQNFFFQNVIENGKSKKEIIAQKTITVEDIERTKAHKRDAVKKVEPKLVPAEDDFIKSNLKTLQNAIFQIREKDITDKEKINKINILLDLTDNPKQDFIVNFLLNVDEESLREAFDKASLSLNNILQKGITETDYSKDNVNKIILNNLVSNVSKRQVAVICAILEQVIVPNLVVDDAATELAKLNAQQSVKPYMVTFEKDEQIVDKGEPITRLKRDALREAGYNVYELNWQGVLSVYILVFVISIIYLAYLKFFEKKYNEPRYLSLSAVLSIIACATGVLLPTGFSPYVIPIPAVVIIASIFLNPRIAFLLSTLILSIMTTGIQYKSQFIVVFILLSLISMITTSKIKYTRRFDLIKLGFHLGIAGVLIMLSLYLIDKCLIDVDNYLIIKDCTFIFINTLISSILALGLSPLLESTFHIITPYGLAELGDHNQALLKRLQMEAPGTYHHSLMVSTLCEAAAEAIGANPILARVGAFYHDIGKLKRPLFFVENQSYFSIENPHNNLTPRLSKMVITAHTKDGVELAKEYGLPSIINDFILQQFRYTGPKPNSKETAILMIADAVESAVRAMKGATSEEIGNIINKIITERLDDGQLEDSPLTLKDIKIIATTFNRVLRGMQHDRIKYQEDIAKEFKKNKIDIPAQALDSDLENKIKELEASKTIAPSDKPEEENDNFHTL